MAKTKLLVNDEFIPLNDFTQRYIGNILRGIAEALGYSSRKVTIIIEPDDLKIFCGEEAVPIQKDFARLIVESTIKGVLSPLNGIFWLERISIVTE
ncbi:hypothetical protein BMS3Abin07_01344 [bacterium BMS3Abin07]|nr:hypothetical protein BMS3Abin07_01344 [bacterium BMS3Abin07]GBE31373.1 hypothetical protein BMS3Bbin05_00273 [bacterium BMS3Bbin05]HDL21368.1 hypothetical protein [Nitrospirota bacterium]HDO22479.1 hypothetical protein [Nitrospirota bacterium]HDZ87794.1 hypothetical protein [Nitrospirota bacterium]